MHGTTLGVGLIGAGSIGSRVCQYLGEGRVPGARVTGVLVRSPAAVTPPGVARVSSIEELLATRPAVVVEAASRAAVQTSAETVLQAGVDLLVVSTGALLDDELRNRLAAVAAGRGARVRLITGAIGGVDALRAAAVDGLEDVEVEQRKPPASLLPPGEARALCSPRTLYEGSVREAVEAFPTTTNILATIALAGLGAERTRVRVVADPSATSNKARLVARGRFGSFELEIDNRASENPRTSLITALSVISALRSMFDPFAIA